MKKFLLAISIAFICGSAFAQSRVKKSNNDKTAELIEKNKKEGFLSGEDEDLDSLFDEAEDIVIDEETSKQQKLEAENKSKVDGAFDSAHLAANTAVKLVNEFFKPLYFFGTLDAELGVYYKRYHGDFRDEKSVVSEYFKFKNDLGFQARVDRTFIMHGLFRIELPQNRQFLLREVYFDYMPYNWLYITAGKKDVAWGYVRMFSNENDYKDTADRLTTNIVADAVDGVSGIITIPFPFVTLTGMALYMGNVEEPNAKDISYAGSLEFTVFKASLNLFGRKTAPNELSKNDYNGIGNVVGFEAKRTVFGFDIYGQASCVFGNTTETATNLEKRIYTVGFYRVWDKFAINVEFQDIYNLKREDNNWKLAIDTGLKQLGRNKDWKIGVQLRHDNSVMKVDPPQYVEDESDKCYVKFGIVKSNAFPHADWKTGFEIYYDPNRDDSSKLYKMRMGSTLHLTINY